MHCCPKCGYPCFCCSDCEENKEEPVPYWACLHCETINPERQISCKGPAIGQAPFKFYFIECRCKKCRYLQMIYILDLPNLQNYICHNCKHQGTYEPEIEAVASPEEFKVTFVKCDNSNKPPQSGNTVEFYLT